jgi:DNA-binding beta-propeller fold protein YncE
MGNCNCKHGSNGTATACPECDILQRSRNNYFTGKLLVERDFTDEQRYTTGKLRRHNQRLHGWGVACGLKVEEHPNPACQAQYVVVEPGTAIDCCGREILLQCEEYFDFESKFLANWQTQNGPNSQPDSNAHTLQICVSYRECPTELVPAVFDDCGSGAGSCQPNRILEGHTLDVLIDPADSNPDPHGVSLEWEFTKNIANTVRAAEDQDSKRLYVLTSATSGGTSNAALYVIETQHYALMASATFANSTGLDVAVDSSGSYIYVAVQPTTAGAAPQLYVYAAAGDFTTTVNQVAVGAATDSTLRLLPYPGTEGSVFAYGETAGFVGMAGLNAAGPSQVVTAAPITPLTAVLSENTQYGYVATNASNSISVIQLAGEAVVVTPITIALPAGAQPASLAIRSTTQGETLAALDTSGNTLYFATIPSAGPASATVLTQTVTPFPNSPMQVLLSPGGRWAYVLEKDATGNAYVQAVDEQAVADNETAVLGPAVAIGVGPQSEALAQNGRHLYIPCINTAQPNLGGVAIVDIAQADCADIFKCLIEGCPDCAQGNCVVLATIPGYVYQSKVTTSMIDNLRGRRLLPSTDLIAKAVQCLIESTPSTGPAGPQGPAGIPGANGATWYEGDGAPAATGNNNDFYLNLATGAGDGDVYQKQAGAWVIVGNIKGPKGDTGPAGPGLETGLVQISALSWVHGDQPLQAGVVSVSQVPNADGNPTTLPGIVIGFSGEVEFPKDPARVFQVLATPPKDPAQVAGFLDPRPIVPFAIVAATINLNPGNHELIASATAVTPTPATTKALAFVFNLEQFDALRNVESPLWVRLRGDFVLDTAAPIQHAISAEFVRRQLPTGYRPQGSTECLEGGTFESWLTLKG